MSLAPPCGLPRRARAELRATIAIEWPRRLFACEDLCELVEGGLSGPAPGRDVMTCS
jgi:hypothetical protein